MVIDIKFRGHKKDGTASITPQSFVIAWQTTESVQELYDKVEAAWTRAGRTEVRRTFYISSSAAFKQLRGRATKYRNKGVGLRKMPDEKSITTPGRVPWGDLAKLAKSVT